MSLVDVFGPIRHVLAVQSHLWGLGFPTEVTSVGYGQAIDPGEPDDVQLCALARLQWCGRRWHYTVPAPERVSWSKEELEREVMEAFDAWNSANADDRIACKDACGGTNTRGIILSLMSCGFWPIA